MGGHRVIPETIDTEQQLRALLGERARLVVSRVVARPNPLTLRFVEYSPFLCLATCDRAGNCDVGPRGDPRGFVRILDYFRGVVRLSMRAALAPAILATFLACGGRALSDAPSSSRVEGSGGEASGGLAGAHSGFGGAVQLPGGAPSSVPAGCPDPNRDDAACPAVLADLDFTSLTGNREGVWVEPLQIPSYGMRPDGYSPSYDLPDPALWDRSALPSGACVFRLHGVAGACLRNGVIFNSTCAEYADPNIAHVAPGGFYDSGDCAQGVAPGCPTADPWSVVGYWWYLLPRGADTDVVVCAPQCAGSFAFTQHACLAD